MNRFRKILLTISSCVLATGIIGGAVSYAVGGKLSHEQFLEKYDGLFQNISEEFSDPINRLEIRSISADVSVEYSSSDKIRVQYDSGTPLTYCNISLDNGTLTVEEKVRPVISMIMMYGFNGGKLTVTLPDKYKNEEIDFLGLSFTSGSFSGDLPKSKEAEIYLTSGDINASIDSQQFKIKATSGNAVIASRAQNMQNASAKVTSGSVTLKAFSADKCEFYQTSGSIYANGLSGNVYTDKTSGYSKLVFADGCSGNVTVKVTSGDTDILLPDGTGVDAQFSGTSGNAEIRLGGTRTTLNKDNQAFSQSGKELVNITIDATSGHTLITDEENG